MPQPSDYNKHRVNHIFCRSLLNFCDRDSSLVVLNLKSSSNFMVTGCVRNEIINGFYFASLRYYCTVKNFDEIAV